MVDYTKTLHRVFSSSSSKFIVGQEKKVFYAHTAAVEKYSKPLGALMNGEMSEAQAGSAVLDNT